MTIARPTKDGKLACCRCDGRFPASLMTAVMRPSGRWNKRQYYCPSCNARRAAVRVKTKDRPIGEVWQ